MSCAVFVWLVLEKRTLIVRLLQDLSVQGVAGGIHPGNSILLLEHSKECNQKGCSVHGRFVRRGTNQLECFN